MKKIRDIFKKNYISFMIASVVILILLSAIIIIKMLDDKKNKIEYSKENVSYYRYFLDKKSTYNEKISRENNKIVKIGDAEVVGNDLLYTENEVIFPYESSVILINEGYKQYYLNKYAEVINSNNSFLINSNGNVDAEYNFIIYDGKDLYFMPDSSTVTVGGQTYDLSIMSYVVANYEGVEIYDYLLDKKIIFDEKNLSVVIKYKNSVIIANSDSIKNNNEILLINNNLDNMQVYKEVNNG